MVPKQSFIFDQYNSNPLVNLICLNLKFLHILHMVTEWNNEQRFSENFKRKEAIDKENSESPDVMESKKNNYFL